MTYNEETILKKLVSDWQKQPEQKRQDIWHANLVKMVESSMAMEGEPVSNEWIKKAKRAAKA
jgi:hypothetical protein